MIYGTAGTGGNGVTPSPRLQALAEPAAGATTASDPAGQGGREGGVGGGDGRGGGDGGGRGVVVMRNGSSMSAATLKRKAQFRSRREKAVHKAGGLFRKEAGSESWEFNWAIAKASASIWPRRLSFGCAVLAFLLMLCSAVAYSPNSYSAIRFSHWASYRSAAAGSPLCLNRTTATNSTGGDTSATNSTGGDTSATNSTGGDAADAADAAGSCLTDFFIGLRYTFGSSSTPSSTAF